MAKRVIALVALIAIGALLASRRTLTAQTITTCQAVGCFGGSPGCYWYFRDGTLEGGITFCYGRR